MGKLKFYTHLKEDVENGEVMCVDVYIDTKTHKLYLPSVVSHNFLGEEKAIDLIFDSKKPSKKELEDWKQEKIQIYNDRIERNIISLEETSNHSQDELENLWK